MWGAELSPKVLALILKQFASELELEKLAEMRIVIQMTVTINPEIPQIPLLSKPLPPFECGH